MKVLLLIVLLCVTVHYTHANIASSMAKEHVVPDVIEVAPKELLEVSYPHDVKVDQGKVLTPTQVKDMPTINWDAQPDQFYTLIMTDPDAPSRAAPKSREWHHWLVGNIPGNNVAGGETLSAYVGSGPPKDTGLHRYVFLIYKQSGKLSFDEPRLTNSSGANRGNFSAKNFATKYTLGNPLAGNFFQAEYDDYVPIVHKQLGF